MFSVQARASFAGSHSAASTFFRGCRAMPPYTDRKYSWQQGECAYGTSSECDNAKIGDQYVCKACWDAATPEQAEDLKQAHPGVLCYIYYIYFYFFANLTIYFCYVIAVSL